MDDRLGLSDAALDGCVASCDAARLVLAAPSRTATSALHGVTDIGVRVTEFVSALAVACGVLAAAAEGVSESATACKRGSDLVEAGAVEALAGGRLTAGADR